MKVRHTILSGHQKEAGAGGVVQQHKVRLGTNSIPYHRVWVQVLPLLPIQLPVGAHAGGQQVKSLSPTWAIPALGLAQP